MNLIKAEESYIVYLPNEDRAIGAIFKEGDLYYWITSHHYIPKAGAAPYHPSVISGPDIDMVRQDLKAYMQGFQNAHEIRAG